MKNMENKIMELVLYAAKLVAHTAVVFDRVIFFAVIFQKGSLGGHKLNVASVSDNLITDSLVSFGSPRHFYFS